MSNERIYVTWYGATPDDLFGNTAADLVPPSPPPPPPRVILTINSTSPSNGVTDVAVNTSVSATFSMLMNGSTLTTDTFQLNNGSDEVAGTVTTNARTATFISLANLDYNTTYAAKITTRAQAANHAGTTLDNDYTWSFTTESAPITPAETPIPTPTTTPTPTPAPTETPTITPSVTPTPAGCSAEKIAVFPANLEIKKGESDVVTVTLTGEDDCRAEGETVKAKITQGKGRISVLPANAITNAEGLSQFTITALKKTGKAKVKFKSGEADSVVKVEVVK